MGHFTDPVLMWYLGTDPVLIGNFTDPLLVGHFIELSKMSY